MATADPRLETIAIALARATQAQGVIRVADLDFEQLAAAVEAIGRAPPGVVTSPADPEGDGLTTTELSAANDG